MSADTIVPGYTNPQSLNRYSYVTNNPLRYTDPTGHMMSDGGGGGNCDLKCVHVHNQKNEKPKKSKKDDLVKTLNSFAIATQDMSTMIDGGFGIVEISLGVAGCVASSEGGCIAGAGGGLLLGAAIYNEVGGNAAETALSGISFTATFLADLIDDKKLGEATATSFATMAVGAAIWDPVGDAIVDIYGSGYNHGYFNGIGTLISSGALFQNRGN